MLQRGNRFFIFLQQKESISFSVPSLCPSWVNSYAAVGIFQSVLVVAQFNVTSGSVGIKDVIFLQSNRLCIFLDSLFIIFSLKILVSFSLESVCRHIYLF